MEAMNILAKTEYNPDDTNNQMSGVEFYRQCMPFEHLRYTHPSLNIAFTNDVQHPDINIKEFDLFHIVRKDITLDKEGNWLQAGNIKAVKDAGLPIVYDIDDLWRLDSTHALYDLYKRNKVSKLTEGWISDATAVTTTTDRLAEYIYKINPNVHIIPNCIHPIMNEFSWSEPDKEPHELVRIGWVGGWHHVRDMSILADFFKQYWKSPLSNISTMVLGGANDHPLMRRIFTIMTANMNKGITNTIPLEAMTPFTYANMYKHIDIAIAPLYESAFNRCKSELKIIEAGHFGIPIVCSDVYPYNTVIEHGYNGYLVRPNESHITWTKYISELVHDESKRFEMGQNLKRTVQSKFNIADANKKRYKLFCELTGKE
jgi:glycosyltransferase involved in cell wall biosynthesis